MSIIQTQAAEPEQSAQSTTLNAVCVDYIDHGVVDTPWGRKPQVEYVFETEKKNNFGEPVFIRRMFTKSMYEKAALRKFVDSWLGTPLTDEEAEQFKFKDQINEQAVLGVEPKTSAKGNVYLKATSVQPAASGFVTPSGLYKRWKK